MTACRWPAFLSAAIAAVLTMVLPLSSASASAGPAAGTRVGASHPVMILPVGSSRAVSAVQGRCEPVPQAQFAAGACVAAEDAGAADLSGYSSFRAAKADLGSAGPGNVYDHVVEQSQIARSGFAPEEIHNPFNLDPVPSEVNQLKANYYSSKQFFTNGGTVRDWLTGQSFADQYEFGMDVLMRIQNRMPLP